MKRLTTVLVLFAATVCFGAIGNRYHGTFTGDGAAVTNIPRSSIGNLEQLYQPSLFGPGETVPGRYAGNNSAGLAVAGAGVSGILQHIWCVPDIAGNIARTNFRNISLQVFADCGNTTNAGNLCFNVPIDLLIGSRLRDGTNGDYVMLRNSRYIDSADSSTNDFFGAPVTTFMVKFPMPFTNGIRVRLYDTRTSTVYNEGYINAFCNLGDLSAPYTTYRLKSAVYQGIPIGGTSNIIANISNSGSLVGFIMSALNETNNVDGGQYFDTVGPRFITGAGKRWEPSGGDDFTMHTYIMCQGPFVGYDFGIINWWVEWNVGIGHFNKWKFETYRWFTGDSFRWTGGLTCWFQPTSTVGPTDYAIFYYGN